MKINNFDEFLNEIAGLSRDFWMNSKGELYKLGSNETHLAYFENKILDKIKNKEIKNAFEYNNPYEVYYGALKIGWISVYTTDKLYLRISKKSDINDKQAEILMKLIKDYEVKEVTIDFLKEKHDEVAVYPKEYTVDEFIDEIL